MKKKRDDYLCLRRVYEPNNIALIIVAESPPVSGLYFYDTTGATTEPLFSAMMKQLGVKPNLKYVGLEEFKRRGWVLCDATYVPVNKLSASQRDNVILENYSLLREDIKQLGSDRMTPVILIKKNVCTLLEPKLISDGFNVINRGNVIYFPSHGWQRVFHEQFNAALKTAAI